MIIGGQLWRPRRADRQGQARHLTSGRFPRSFNTIARNRVEHSPRATGNPVRLADMAHAEPAHSEYRRNIDIFVQLIGVRVSMSLLAGAPMRTAVRASDLTGSSLFVLFACKQPSLA
jgi:hypothetical protein